jgi:adenylosuccinate synthase
VPSGVLNPKVELFIGGGTVVSIAGLLGELDRLAAIGIDVSRVKISDRAHVVLAYHAARDRAGERARGDRALGTTGRGIGPAYVDKVARSGILFADLARPEAVAGKIRFNIAQRPATGGDDELPGESELIEETLTAAQRLLPHVVDGVDYIHSRLAAGKRVLIEGAQGSLLDIGYGTYPFVTSSHTIAGGACIGLGIGPTAIGHVIGVVKAYCTRVGAGPFPSELHDDRGERMRRQGNEFGTVTGRPRRCGWFDAVAGRYAVLLNGLSSIAITKLDVLTGFEKPSHFRRPAFPVWNSTSRNSRAGPNPSAIAAESQNYRPMRNTTLHGSPSCWTCQSTWSPSAASAPNWLAEGGLPRFIVPAAG